jgi:hypothetical protein
MQNIQTIKDFILTSVEKSKKSERSIYVEMGKHQQSFSNMKESGKIYVDDFIKFCEVTGAEPTDLFQSIEYRKIKGISDCEQKLLKAYELLIKHGIKFDFGD